jgi:8-oxo-dGTP pyrophosphatase MutT (NUDIX family)
MKPWKTLSREIVLTLNKFLTVENHRIELPDGRIINDWPWIVTPDYVNIVAVTPDNKFICFRQTKYAVEGISLAVVGGHIEPDELPLNAAKRELLEETGFASEEWIPLGNYPVDANRGVGRAHFYLATNAYKISDPIEEDLEEQELLFLSYDELQKAISKNEFKCLSWIAPILLALRKLDENF